MKKLTAILLIIFTYQSVQASANIPGPRDCFWLRGPVSGDPYIKCMKIPPYTKSQNHQVTKSLLQSFYINNLFP